MSGHSAVVPTFFKLESFVILPAVAGVLPAKFRYCLQSFLDTFYPPTVRSCIRINHPVATA